MISSILAGYMIQILPHSQVATEDLCCLHQDQVKPLDDKKTKELLRFQSEIENDKRIGKEASDFCDREYKQTKDTASQVRVEEIGAKLALLANSTSFETLWGDKRLAEFEYKFKVVDSKDVNAFSLPGGYIYVNQGLVDFCQSDDELAGVLAHEITHALQRHVAWLKKEQDKMLPFQIPLILAGIVTGGATMALGQLGSTAITNGWSQKAENSADYGGFQMMTAGGFDPTGMVTFMERLQMKDGGMERVFDLGIYRTHPPSKLRADNIESYMRKAKMPIRRSNVTNTFRVSLKSFNNDAQGLFFGRKELFKLGITDRAARAQAITKDLNLFFDQVPEMYQVQVGDNGVIYGKNRVIVRLTEEDAIANGTSLEALQNDVTKHIRACIFQLAYHLWEGRG
jgi:beta-barrel assembly-enhancing protease